METVERREQGVEYLVGGEKVTLTPATVKQYLVSGDASNVTMQEIVMFINICRYNRLNPWLKEAYCVKYGNSPATMVVSKEAYLKRAEANPNYDGSEAGILVRGTDGKIVPRVGTFYDQESGEKVVGGWAEVWRKDRAHSCRVEVPFVEYAGKKKDGSLNGQWSSKPATMIRKVALAQALRESFPDDLGAMYVDGESSLANAGVTKAEEVPTSDDPFKRQEVQQKPDPVPEAANQAEDEIPFA